MPRAVTRAISSSFAGAPHTRGSSMDIPSSKASSMLDMYPSPRPSKVSNSSSVLAALPSSPPARRAAPTTDCPTTPPLPSAGKRKRGGDDAGMPQRQVETFLANYDLEAENRIRMANQALQVSIESARAQMIASISAFPRHVLTMRLEEYLAPTPPPTSALEQPGQGKKASARQVPAPLPAVSKTPRAARPGEVVYSARGSPITLLKLAGGGLGSSDEEEPSFDTASDKSSTSESFSLPDEVAYTAQIIEQERNRILSSEGFLPRSSSMFHRSSST